MTVVRLFMTTALPKTEFGFHISPEIEKRMSRWRVTVRDAIRQRLGEIAASHGKHRSKAKAVAQKEPPLRFYVYEANRRIVVLDIQLLDIE
jgi:hypothetical protein